MNLPGDYVHHIKHSFCWLVVPLKRSRWLAFSWKFGFVVIGNQYFHNCTRTGVY